MAGALRLANSHSNDASGFYNPIEVAGINNSHLNPDGKNLIAQMDSFEGGKYFISQADHWGGIFPSESLISFEDTNNHRYTDYFQLGYRKKQFFITESEYSKGYVVPEGGTQEDNDAVVYAIRFKKTDATQPKDRWESFPYGDSEHTDGSYQPLRSDSLRCAYRYTRIGGKKHTLQIRVDVVYLGETDFREAGKSELETISNQAWWDDTNPVTSKRLQARLTQVITRTFPLLGVVRGIEDPHNHSSPPCSASRRSYCPWIGGICKYAS